MLQVRGLSVNYGAVCALEGAVIEVPAGERAKLRKDLGAIIEYFKELEGVPTDGVEPMSGGTLERNVFRSDDTMETALPNEAAIKAFPEKQNGFLKVPPVFE